MSRSSIKLSSIFIVISLDAEDCRIVSVAKSTLVVETSCLSSLSSSRLCHVCLSLFHSRSDLTTVCKGMKFSRFPLDEHVCYLKLTSCKSRSFPPSLPSSLTSQAKGLEVDVHMTSSKGGGTGNANSVKINVSIEGCLKLRTAR